MCILISTILYLLYSKLSCPYCRVLETQSTRSFKSRIHRFSKADLHIGRGYISLNQILISQQFRVRGSGWPGLNWNLFHKSVSQPLYTAQPRQNCTWFSPSLREVAWTDPGLCASHQGSHGTLSSVNLTLAFVFRSNIGTVTTCRRPMLLAWFSKQLLLDSHRPQSNHCHRLAVASAIL